jgi:hypothetical protein
MGLIWEKGLLDDRSFPPWGFKHKNRWKAKILSSGSYVYWSGDQMNGPQLNA